MTFSRASLTWPSARIPQNLQHIVMQQLPAFRYLSRIALRPVGLNFFINTRCQPICCHSFTTDPKLLVARTSVYEACKISLRSRGKAQNTAIDSYSTSVSELREPHRNQQQLKKNIRHDKRMGMLQQLDEMDARVYKSEGHNTNETSSSPGIYNSKIRKTTSCLKAASLQRQQNTYVVCNEKTRSCT